MVEAQVWQVVDSLNNSYIVQTTEGPEREPEGYVTFYWTDDQGAESIVASFYRPAAVVKQ
jgi:hypothetical protein